MRKYKLHKNNTLTKIINKSNYKPGKLNKVGKKVVLAAGILNIANKFAVSDLSVIVNALNAISLPLLTYSLFCSTKQIGATKSKLRLNNLSIMLSSKGIVTTPDSLMGAEIVSKDGIDLIPTIDNGAILQAEDNYGNVMYSYYRDDEFADITDIVNDVVLTKRQKRKYNVSKQTDDELYNMEF